ncbi:MAG: methionine aminopeptidase [Bacteroidetes bacterium OLB12]|nr:MAG: methionine aminopeptidase [Bacteroidetes bacterium OLB12]
MIRYKTDEEIQLMRESAQLLGKVHGEIAKRVKPGIKTNELNKLAEEFISDHGAWPSFKNYHGFPAALCISVNEVVVHGFPSEYELKETDIVSIDCGVKYKGYHSDSAYTYPLEKVDAEVLRLLERTYESLEIGISQARAGNRMGDVSASIQQHVEQFGYGVVRELVGHGVGKDRSMKILKFQTMANAGREMKLAPGMVFAIEPMINMGTKKRGAGKRWMDDTNHRSQTFGPF